MGKDNIIGFYVFISMTFVNIIVCFVATATVNLAKGKVTVPNPLTL